MRTRIETIRAKWVTVGPDGWRCERCGCSAPWPAKAPVRAVIRLLDVVLLVHRGCRERTGDDKEAEK